MQRRQDRSRSRSPPLPEAALSDTAPHTPPRADDLAQPAAVQRQGQGLLSDPEFVSNVLTIFRRQRQNLNLLANRLDDQQMKINEILQLPGRQATQDFLDSFSVRLEALARQLDAQQDFLDLLSRRLDAHQGQLDMQHHFAARLTALEESVVQLASVQLASEAVVPRRRSE